MKTRFLLIVSFLFLSMSVTFFILGQDILALKHSSEVAMNTIETLQQENEEIQHTLVDLEKEKADLITEMEKLTKEKAELEDKVNDLSSQKTETADVQKKTNAEKQTEADKKSKKIAYLTFDDGPSKNTEKILGILREKNVKATFFVNGYPSKKDLYKQIVNDGHTLGNHTYSHNYAKVYSSVDEFFKDMNKLNDFLEEVTGVRPSIVRFPGGSNNTISHQYGGTKIMNKIVSKVVESGYQYFDWNVSSRDAEKRTQDKNVIIHSVLEGAKYKNKAVILLHDLDPKTTTVEALPEIIDELTKQGFVFDALDENSYAPHFL